MRPEKVATLFDTAEHAESARANLEKAGFSVDDISIVGRKDLADNVLALREPGLWNKLLGRDIAEYEARVYGKTVEGGGVVLTLRVSDSQLAKAMGILNQHHIVDVSHTTRTDSLITRLTSVVKPSTLKEIGVQLGVPEQAVSRGLASRLRASWAPWRTGAAIAAPCNRSSTLRRACRRTRSRTARRRPV